MPLGVEQWLRSHIPRKARGALYAGKMIVTGNKISAEYGKKSRRIWRPNVLRKRLYSESLGQDVELKLTAHALRQIDRAGGLDRWLLKTPDSLLHSDVGSDLRFRVGLIHKQRWFERVAALRRDATEGALRLGAGGDAAASAALTAPPVERRGQHQQHQRQQQQGQQSAQRVAQP